MLKQTRQCLHAGEWYTNKHDSAAELNAELGQYINNAKKQQGSRKVKALIGPHAGLYFSGPTAGWAYQYITRPNSINRVFIIGPSHHKYFPGCALTYMDQYNTPLGPLEVDIEVVDKLKAEEGFFMLDIDDQEDQHSIEMHLPFIIKALGKNIKIVPILSGPVNQEMASNYGKIFAPYFDDPNTLFIISTDFCHWGQKHNYTYHNEHEGQIWQSIEKLDGEAMNLIQNHDFKAFEKYINSSKNTICGRHPLFIFLKIIENSQMKVKTKFVKYSQSQQVKSQTQNSVSYASAITFEQ